MIYICEISRCTSKKVLFSINVLSLQTTGHSIISVKYASLYTFENLILLVLPTRSWDSQTLNLLSVLATSELPTGLHC